MARQKNDGTPIVRKTTAELLSDAENRVAELKERLAKQTTNKISKQKTQVRTVFRNILKDVTPEQIAELENCLIKFAEKNKIDIFDVNEAKEEKAVTAEEPVVEPTEETVETTEEPTVEEPTVKLTEDTTTTVAETTTTEAN